MQPEDDFVLEPVSPRASKRTRVQPEASTSRTTRRKSQASALAVTESPTGKSARAAKLQANKKLDAQARELAEFQRQNAALSREKEKATRSKVEGKLSPTKRSVVGTRASARLRGPVVNEDDEWQPIPDEWLMESAGEATLKPKKGKAKELIEEAAVEAAAEELERVQSGTADNTGLDSDDVSELTELSELTEEQEQGADEAEAETVEVEPEVEPDVEVENVQRNGKLSRGRKTRGGGRRSPRKKEQVDNPASDLPEPPEAPQDDAPPIPDDFIEWEAVSNDFYGDTVFMLMLL